LKTLRLETKKVVGRFLEGSTGLDDRAAYVPDQRLKVPDSYDMTWFLPGDFRGCRPFRQCY
jgi:hypothetical protein